MVKMEKILTTNTTFTFYTISNVLMENKRFLLLTAECYDYGSGLINFFLSFSLKIGFVNLYIFK